jgi:hypothetical protein
MCTLLLIAYLNQYREFLINSQRWQQTYIHSLQADVLYLTTSKQIFVQKFKVGF